MGSEVGRRGSRQQRGRAAPVSKCYYPSYEPPDEIRFGAAVELRGDDGQTRRLAIVGQDEAEGAADKLAWDSALALALMGAKKGDRIETEESGALTVVSIDYPGR